MATILTSILTESLDAEVISKAGSDMVGTYSAKGAVALWNYLLRKNYFRTADFLVNTVARLLPMPLGDAFDVCRLLRRLDEVQPDVLVSTADIYSKILGTYSSEKNIPLYIMIADISPYHDVVNPRATHFCYFQETVHALQSFDLSTAYFSCAIGSSTSFTRKMSYLLRYWNDHILHWRSRPMIHQIEQQSTRTRNDLVCMPMGPLAVRECFCAADRDDFRETVGIKKGRKNLLIASGSIGGRFVREIVEILCDKWNHPSNLLVMCGHDNSLYEHLKSLRQKNENICVHPFRWVDNFHDFLAISDCLVGRHSASVFVDSLVLRVPCVAYGYILSNDRGTAHLIQQYRLGELTRNKAELLRKLQLVIDERAQYVENINSFLAPYLSTYNEMAELITQVMGKHLAVKAGIPRLLSEGRK